jgi:hypothetical protein
MFERILYLMSKRRSALVILRKPCIGIAPAVLSAAAFITRSSFGYVGDIRIDPSVQTHSSAIENQSD